METKEAKIQNDPVEDLARIEEIARLRLHEDYVDEILNSYTEKAAKEFNLGTGLVSIVLTDTQKFAGSYGLGDWIEQANGTPVEWSFCANSVRTNNPFVVEDATQHEMVKDNPLVTMDGIKCYAGVPLISRNNFVVGNFCVLGGEPREFRQDEIEKLKVYASLVMDRIEEKANQ